MKIDFYSGDGKVWGETADRRERMWLGDVKASDPAWQEWLRRHGIEPDDVLIYSGGIEGWVERQEGLYRIAWLAPARDERGKPVRGVRERYVQLEGKPLPFPPWPRQVA